MQLYIEIHDDDSDGTDEFMDFVLVDYSLVAGESSLRQNYTGIFGFITMDLSITVLCARHFQGDDCTLCAPGFTGPNCDIMDTSSCIGMECSNGEFKL